MMKRLAEYEDAGLVSLMGETITCLCMNYFYTGKLTGINGDCIELTDPSIVYETGKWSEKKWADAQALPTARIFIMKSSIEAYGVLK
jgi:hypothetical protein